MTKKILLVNDMPGYGKVAIPAMTPILVRYGYELFNLPTMIVSNTLNYKKFASIDTTDYMKEALQTWEELGFGFDAVSTGFIANDEQAEFVLDLCKKKAKEGTLIFADPIMADNGKLYNSITRNRVETMKKIVSVADFIVPNLTEACYLTDTPYREEGFEKEELCEIIKSLRKLGAKSVIVTSTLIRNENESKKAVACYDKVFDECFFVEYDEIPVKVNGTGDVFSAIVMAETLEGQNLKKAVEKATFFIHELIEKNMDVAREYNGLPIEASIHTLD